LTQCLRYETLQKVKPAIFHPSARETIRSFPVEVRKELGKAIFSFAARTHSGYAAFEAYAIDCD
jgi:phage-related protein